MFKPNMDIKIILMKDPEEVTRLSSTSTSYSSTVAEQETSQED